MTKRIVIAPITDKVPNLRQRPRANGTWRVWWEPPAAARARGVEAVELDADRPTWSIRKAKTLNEQATRTIKGAAAKAGQGHNGRTVTALIHAYRRDPEYTEKKPATRKSYDANLRLIETKWGDASVASFTKPVIREWYLTLRRTAGETQAVRLVGMFSILFGFAEMKGWRTEGANPAQRIKMKIPAPRARVATWAELDALVASADRLGLPDVGTACLLSALQGQRQTDVIQATRGDFRRMKVVGAASVWAWRVDRSKRGTLGMMQLHPDVLARLAHALGQTDDTALIISRQGEPYSHDQFAKHFARVRTQAAKIEPTVTGRDPITFRDLRRTFSVWSRAGGASDDDVGDVLGNSAALDPRLQETYMPATFDTASRAVLSIARPKEETRKREQ